MISSHSTFRATVLLLSMVVLTGCHGWFFHGGGHGRGHGWHVASAELVTTMPAGTPAGTPAPGTED